MIPPIEKMDATLSTLKACKWVSRTRHLHLRWGNLVSTRNPPHTCRHLALSTNNIEKISSLSGMENLRILSLGRNLIKKIENLDAVADTLEELWISYNQIASLVRPSEWTCGDARTLHNVQNGHLHCSSVPGNFDLAMDMNIAVN